MGTQIEKTEIKNLLEMVYLPYWNTHAYICKDGTIYVQLILGKFHTKREFYELEKDKHNDDFMESRMRLFDDLKDYYNEKVNT